MQVYVVNIQNLLILYTLAQKKVKYCTNFENMHKTCNFFLFAYNINLHFKHNVYIKKYYENIVTYVSIPYRLK